MIDIHSHIIFDVDDGPLTIDESLSLLEESYMQGVRTLYQHHIAEKECLKQQKMTF